MKILLLGMNHKTAPLEVRERYAAEDVGAALEKLIGSDEIDEAVVLSTCNRVEVIVTSRQPDAARHRLRSFFANELGGAAGAAASPADLEAITYLREGRDAVGHVFRVAASMDSMVVGEPQILGQIKDAYREAAEHGAAGPVLSRLFQRAFATAKRVKNETRISERPVSVARVAVDLARQIFEDLREKSALLVGAGEMIEAALFALHREGLGERRIVNRTVANAQALADRFSGTAHGLDELDLLLERSDVVLTCIGGDGPLLDAARVGHALRARRNRPLFLIDIGVPRNVAPEVNDLDYAFLYDIDDLQEVASANVAHRERESERAEQVVAEEQAAFDGWLVALRAVPTIRHLRARADAVRQRELERFAGRLGLDDAQREGVEQLTRAIVNKILHAPLASMRQETDREDGLARLEAARELFALDDPAAPGGHVDGELHARAYAGAVGLDMLEGDPLDEPDDLDPEPDPMEDR